MQFFKATIRHSRSAPVKNSFSYKGFYFSFWLDEMGESGPRFFSWEKFNLFSFYQSDHGWGHSFYEDPKALHSWAKQELERAGIQEFKGRILLVTLPRVMGYVFNPVSFWYCYDEESLKAVICEVNNTFGEGHNYIVVDPKQNSDMAMKKSFHVSPFYPVKGEYRFNFEKENRVIIKYSSDQGNFMASLEGEKIKHSRFFLISLFLQHPFYTFFIVALIHFQALKLFLKKVPFHKKPDPPEVPSTTEYL